MKVLFVILIMLICLSGFVRAVEPYVDFREWRRLSDRDISRFATSLLRGKKDDFLHAESTHFIGHGATKKYLDRALRKAEVAWIEGGQQLKLMPTQSKAHLFILNDTSWRQLKRKYQLKPAAKAFQYKQEMFITEAAAVDETFRDDVIHEVVHLRLNDAYRDKLPLAVEEGLAHYVGWQISRDYHKFHGHYLERKRPSLHPDKLFPLDELTQMEEYPSDATAMIVFNRQSEAWIEALVGLIGKDKLGVFIKQVSRGKRAWPQILIEQFDCTPEQVAGLEEATKAIAIQSTP